VKLVLTIVGGLAVLLGGVWILQGINVLPGSFMTGQIKWAVYGGVMFLVGLWLLISANRRRVGTGAETR
jgi:hypothetical protein